MKFISDPTTAVKIEKMKTRLRSQHPLLFSKGIDRTRFELDDGKSGDREFSFLVIGDSGSGRHIKNNPQRQIAEQMVRNQDNCRFIVHTGDVIYLVGSSEYYSQNFIEPYREFIVGGEHPDRIPYNNMVFKLPILPVPGNHDYYDLPLLYGAIAQAAQPLRHLLRGHFNLDVGWHGSDQGKAYARAFLRLPQRYSRLPTRRSFRSPLHRPNGHRTLFTISTGRVYPLTESLLYLSLWGN